MPPRRILLVFLNTGGGHRSAALAVGEALESLHGERAQLELVDVTADYFRWPLSKLNAIYQRLVGLSGWPWALTYYLTDGRRRVTTLEGAWWLLTRRSVRELLRDHPADAILCCHPLLKAPLARAQQETQARSRLVTLVTDLASGHTAWFYPPVGTCLVGTEQARLQALACGHANDSVQTIGLPVRPCFAEAAARSSRLIRRRLGLEPERPVLLLLSGADGLGPFCSLLEAVTDHVTGAQVVAVAGRNEQLQAKLASRRWPCPLQVKGFIDNIHDWMRAADLLVSKAGPSTIAEALVVGTPMVLSGAIPGQETPNVGYATGTGAAVWAPGPDRAAEAVQRLLSRQNNELRRMTERARAAGCPNAARLAAQIVWRAADQQPPG